MGWYARRVFPYLCDWSLRGAQVAEQRRELLAEAADRVLEVGFGTGLNLPCYPAAVRELFALEPVSMLRARVARRIAASPLRVCEVQGRCEALPVATASVHCVVVTFTLCSVTDPTAALCEIARVLQPGGRLLFLEHGLSSQDRLAQWQHRLTPLQRRLGAGCHLNRPIAALIEAAGLTIERLERPSLRSVPRVLGELYRGVARIGTR